MTTGQDAKSFAETRASHANALQSASIKALTIHGLRPSFSLLGEAAGAPAGAIAQVMGNKPSATAEGYRPRSVDALRLFLEQIETHILVLAGVQFDAKAKPGTFRVVYIAKLADAVYVLHCFQKKTQQTAKRDIDLARQRLKALMKELAP